MKKNNLTLSAIFLAILTFIQAPLVLGQQKSYTDIEETQDEIESLYVEVYNIINDYPETTYRYVYEDGRVTEVVIKGVQNNYDKKQLEVHLIDLEELKKEIYNMSNRMGIYYVAETEAKPSAGFDEFYEQLVSSVNYPSAAEDRSVEGIIFVKFLVDQDGNINHVVASEDLETSANWVVDEMKDEAKEAVKATSGKWEPAKVAGYPVAQWVVLPVQFKLDRVYFEPIF